MDRCPLHSTIGANSCSRPVPNPARHLRLQPSRASLVGRQSNSAQVVCLWHRLFRDTVKNGLKNQPAGAESCVASEIDRLARGRCPARRLFCRNGGAVTALKAGLGVPEPSKTALLQPDDCCAEKSS